MTNNLPSYSRQNPHPTAVIREMRYLVRNAIAFYAPIATWCLKTKLIKVSDDGHYEIAETGRQYLERYREYDPETD